MSLMEQCQRWNAEGAHQNIIDAIETVSDAERTPELISELARAYNNIAAPEDRPLYQKAIALLQSVEEHFQGEHNWNFRMGYAYYYLDEEGPALRYFEKALDARPGDEDTQELIDDCRKRLGLPRFARSFRERTEAGWKSFLAGEEGLRAMMDAGEDSEKLMEQASALLAPAFSDTAFEMGFNGQKHELILTPEGSLTKLFELVYFQRHVPAAVLERWNVLVGRQRSNGFGLRVFEQEISGSDVRVWVERSGDSARAERVSLYLFCEKLLPLLREEEGKVWWLLSILVDQVLGEIPVMELVDGFEVLDAPRPAPGISLDALPETLQQMGLELQGDPERMLENGYTAYEMEPAQDADADLRLDVFIGSTRCPMLVNEYLHGESGAMDAFHRNGAVPGFFYYPLDSFHDREEQGKAVLDFRDALEAAVLKTAGADTVTFTGGATGLYCGYLDFIAWDLPAVLNAAKAFFKDSPVAWSAFHTFRRNVGGVSLTDREKDDPAETGGDETDATGSFAGFVLLRSASWDKDGFIRSLKAEWDLDVEAGEEDALVFSVGDCMAAVSLMPAPVPDGEAERNAANNYLWPEAVAVTKTHQAHLLVAVLGQEAPLIERGKLFAKILACCCRQENAIGVYTSGTVFQPELYRDFADMMKEDELPVFNWIWFGLYQNERGNSAYTYGMKVFGKEELEVLDTEVAPGELRDFLTNLVWYVLGQDVTLQDGETIGFSEEQKLPITRSEGVSLPGMTLKIGGLPGQRDRSAKEGEA